MHDCYMLMKSTDCYMLTKSTDCYMLMKSTDLAISTFTLSAVGLEWPWYWDGTSAVTGYTVYGVV